MVTTEDRHATSIKKKEKAKEKDRDRKVKLKHLLDSHLGPGLFKIWASTLGFESSSISITAKLCSILVEFKNCYDTFVTISRYGVAADMNMREKKKNFF